MKDNVEKLKKSGCNFQILDNADGIWYDYGNMEDRHLSKTEVVERFKKCSAKNCVILTPDCYLGRCERHMAQISVFGEIVRRGAGEKREYIDLLNDGDMVGSELEELLEAETLRACNYCNGDGDTNNMVCAGEQVKSLVGGE